MQAEIKKKFLFLKFDCATRLKVNYLGVNIRYVSADNEAVTKTLMVSDTKSQHTSAQLKAMLYKIMADFEIQPSQVICCITDNASNMVKLVKDFNQDIKEESQGQATVEGREESADQENEESEAVAGASNYESDTDDDDEDVAHPPPVLDDALYDSSIRMSLPGTSHIRCGVHTLQESFSLSLLFIILIHYYTVITPHLLSAYSLSWIGIHYSVYMLLLLKNILEVT
jgi:hypothetical protein